MAVQWLNVSFVFRILERRRQRKGTGLKAEKNNTISRKKFQDYRDLGIGTITGIISTICHDSKSLCHVAHFYFVWTGKHIWVVFSEAVL